MKNTLKIKGKKLKWTTLGFTLIELLAVIVILAIIALIAVPIVIHIIDDSKKSSEKETIKLYLDTVEKMVAKKQLNNTSFNPKTCTIGNKKITCDSEVEVDIEMKGETPNSGTIFFSNGKLYSAINLELNGKKFKLENGEIKEGETKETEIVLTQILGVIGSNYTGTCKITGTNKITCGTETEKSMDIPYTVSGGVITFANGQATEYKNLKVNGTYYHKKSGEEETNTQNEVYLCTKVTAASTTSITKGDKYTCKVKSDMATPYTFYVLTDPADGQVNMIMDRNICNDGSITYTSTNNYCRYKWYSAANNNTYGPTTVMAELYAGTKDWDNVDDMIMNYTDENNGTATDMGYTSIITDTSTKITTITGKPTTNTSIVGTASKPLKARIPKQSEVMGAGCTTGAGSCPTWIMENMTYYNTTNDKYSMNNNSEAYQNQFYGYWLLSSNPGGSAFARLVYYDGSVYNVTTTNGYYGARPVITVSTSDLSN